MHDNGHCFFEGLENKSKQEQIKHFIFQLKYRFKGIEISEDIKSWKEAFIQLYEIIKEQPMHIVFDEFQWMANYRKEIVSELKFVWERFFSHINGITLILCGSIASFMISKVLKSNAMYGRVDLEINLKAFTIAETQKMLSGRNILELMEAQFFTGGIPKYIDLLSEKKSIRIGMQELCFEETGYYFSEYNRIFTSHFGKNPEYEKIITTLSKHPNGLSRIEIADNIKSSTGGLLTEYLRNLESADFIKSFVPFNKPYNSKHMKYILVDAYLRFYLTFIKPYINKIKSRSSTDMFRDISQTGIFYAWLGRSFEYFCIQHAVIITKILGFSGIEYKFGPYFRPSTKKNAGIQIDLLFDRRDNVISMCEMKYTNRPVGIAVINEVEKKAEFLEQVSGKKTIHKILITKSNPTLDLQKTGYFYQIIKMEEFFKFL